jgi:two-component system, cell cycle sensor histidine kinase and response regulator CckA
VQSQFAITLASMMGGALEREATEALALRAQKMEAVGRLAGGVAHDFNNLLTVMITVGSELRELRIPSTEAALDDLDTATQGAMLLSNQLLALSRREQQAEQALDLGGLVTDLLPMLRRLVGSDVKVVEQLEHGPQVTVLGDRSGLEQVLLNLIMNARQAMPGGGTITISVRAAPDGFVELGVKDTGAGMDEATLARIFEAFFTTKPDGSGLGLATVASVVERHGGKVSATSEVGAGSTFTVRIPTMGAARISTPDQRLSSDPQPAPHPSPVRSILLVDDHELLRQTTTRLLHSLGFDVVAKANAIEAMELLRSPRRFSLVITDVNMPGLQGTALVEELDRLGLQTPVLFISGFVDPTTSAAAGKRRTHFLAKPFLPEQLVAAVNGCLKLGAGVTSDRRA